MPSDKTWGIIFGLTTAFAATPFIGVAGALSVLSGRPFGDGIIAIAETVEIAAKFGEKHGQLIEKTLVKAAVWTVVGGIGDGVADEVTDVHPPKGPDA